MALVHELENSGNWLFKRRSWLPLFFVAGGLLMMYLGNRQAIIFDMRDEMIFIGSDRYLGDSCTVVDLTLLQNSRLILREQGSGTRFYWEEYRKEKKIILPESSLIMEVGSLSAIKSLVEAGYGCSVMSREAVEKELLLGSLRTRPFSWGPLIRDLNFIYTEDSPGAFVEEFIRFCR